MKRGKGCHQRHAACLQRGRATGVSGEPTPGMATEIVIEHGQRLAGGDLAFQLNEAFAPDFEALRHDFNRSVGCGIVDGGLR